MGGGGGGGAGSNPNGVRQLRGLFLRIAGKFSLLFASHFLLIPFWNPLFNMGNTDFIQKNLGGSNTIRHGFFF